MEAPVTRPAAPASALCLEHSDPVAFERAQEDTVVKLVDFLGKESLEQVIGVKLDSEQIPCLFSSDVPDQDDVLVLPSLNIELSEMKKGGSSGSLLPGVGETSRLKNANIVNSNHNAVMQLQQQSQRSTVMAASVLASATRDAADAEHEVAKSLGTTTSWTKSTVASAPSVLVNNMADSFKRLVDSRMKAWTLLLLRHSLSTGDESSRKRLLGVLAASLKVKAVTTKFRTLQLPDSAKGHHKEADVILPLLFEARVVIYGQEDKTKPQTADDSAVVRAPGTISADFAGSSLKVVKIQLDCNSLLSSMVEQARILVLKVVAAATKTQVPATSPTLSGYHSPQQQQQHPHDEGPPVYIQTPLMNTSRSLASFRSALNLSPSPSNSEQSHQLVKARCSALRLNNVLQGKQDQSSLNGSSSGLRKTRSVRWNTPGEIPKLCIQPGDTEDGHSIPTPKKARGEEMNDVPKLKSFKSFGRPHAGDFGSGPRNATFGEFGGAGAYSRGLWGRDGRMAVHPTPLKDAAFSDPISGEYQPASKNAAFNLQVMSANMMKTANRPSIHLASGVGSANALPRTATVLESLLMKRSMN